MNPAEVYILEQPEPFRSMLLHLQVVIEQTVPEAEMLYKYKIPFYYVNGKPFCYLNATNNYIDVGFWHAAHLSVYLEHMTTAGRKMMRSLRYAQPDEIREEVLIAVLHNAYAVRDKKFYKS